LGNRKYSEEHDRENNAGNRSNLLCQEINDTQCDESERYQAETHGKFHTTDLEIKRHTEFSLAAVLVAKDHDGETFHRKAPHHTKRIRLSEEKDISAAEDDREELKTDDQVQNSMGSSEPPVRMTEPVRQDSVFGYSIQHSVRPHD